MKLQDIFIRASRNLVRSKLRTVLTVLAILIGAFTVMLTSALGEGVRHVIDVQISSVSAKNAIIVRAKQDEAETMQNPSGSKPAKYNPNASVAASGIPLMGAADLERIKSVEGVDSAFQSYVTNPEYITNAQIGDKFQLSLSAVYKGIDVSVIAGESPKESESGYVIITEKYVAALGYKNRDEAIGKKVQVAYANSSGELLLQEYSIKAVVGNSFINNGSSYISLVDAEKVNTYQTKGTPIEGKFHAVIAVAQSSTNNENLNSISDRIKQAGFHAETLDDQISSIKGVITVVQLVIGIFGVLTITASVFGIVNTLMMSVFERTKEIGLMKAVGMSKGSVFMLFSIEAGSIGFWGGAGGVLLAYGVGSMLNKYLMSINFLGFEGINFFIFPPVHMALVTGALVVVGLLSGVLPAMKASSLNPIEALRHE